MKTMDYEEKYKKALQRARIWKYKSGMPKDRQGILDDIFPDLAESEDERIIKEMHIYLDWLDGRKDYQPKGEYTIRDMIDWLGRQGETYTKKDVDDAWLKGLCDAKRELEMQMEKPTERAESGHKDNDFYSPF